MCQTRSSRIVLSSLIVFCAALGLFGHSGFVYAADRTVVGELWSQDG